ncbi:MAG: hypothetical protein R3F65_14890 [bacterium]
MRLGIGRGEDLHQELEAAIFEQEQVGVEKVSGVVLPLAGVATRERVEQSGPVAGDEELAKRFVAEVYVVVAAGEVRLQGEQHPDLDGGSNAGVELEFVSNEVGDLAARRWLGLGIVEVASHTAFEALRPCLLAVAPGEAREQQSMASAGSGGRIEVFRVSNRCRNASAAACTAGCVSASRVLPRAICAKKVS